MCRKFHWLRQSCGPYVGVVHVCGCAEVLVNAILPFDFRPSPRIPTGYVILDVSSVMLNSLWLDTNLMSHNLRESFCSWASCFASDFAGRVLEVDVAVGRSSSTNQYEDKLFFWRHLGCLIVSNNIPYLRLLMDWLRLLLEILLPSNTHHYNIDYYSQILSTTRTRS